MKPSQSTPYDILRGASRVIEEDIKRRQAQQEEDPEMILKPGEGMTIAGYIREMARAVEVKRQTDIDMLTAMKDKDLKELIALATAELKERSAVS